MANSRSRTPSAKTENQSRKSQPVCCMDCRHARLIRYGTNPVLAECHEKPNPGNGRFPYQREVARPMRICAMHSHDGQPKQIEQRDIKSGGTEAA